MAAAWFNKMRDRTNARAIAAATQLGERVHSEVLQVTREVGKINGQSFRFTNLRTGDFASLAQAFGP
jgi:hypothetical protein